MDEARSAELVLACRELAPSLAFWTERLGFRLEAIFPADDPSVAELSGHGLRLRLERGDDAAPAHVRIAGGEPATLVAPEGTRVELVGTEDALHVPPPRLAFTHTRASADAPWVVGRAGMLYRDLVPGRLGGHLVASHIRIPEDGPVPDSVHFHEVRFQMIFCRRGEVRLVYEDQGPPFVLAAGDCVLQPPRIRHRVLASSGGLEVIELAVPAAHPTRLEHAFGLPTPEVRPGRDFGGQRFVRHEAARATWRPWRLAGFEARDLGLGAATGGLAQARVARRATAPAAPAPAPACAFHFLFVLAGSATFLRPGHPDAALAVDDALLVPAGEEHALTDVSRDLELLEVGLRT